MKILLNGDLNMRLYNVYYVCKSIFPDLKNFRGDVTASNTYKLKSWVQYKNALQNLITIDFIREDAIATYKVLNPIDVEQKIPEIGGNTYKELLSKNTILLTKISAVIDLYESMKDGTSKPGIDIKIPACESLKEYIDILKEIDFVLNQCPYLKSDTEEIRYKGTDVGSEWITFAIIVSGAVSTSFIILNNLSSLIKQAIAIKSNKKILDMQEETYKSMQLKNEITQETIDAFKKMKELTYKKYVDELQEELGELKDGEEEGKVSKSLEKLASLIDKGVEIHTSIETPMEVKVLFPFVETQQSLPDNLQKYLEEKSSQNSDK